MSVISYVYLLVEEDGRAFKIGHSVDPAGRCKVLPNRIDYSRSLQFSFGGKQARAAERLLHFLFRKHRQVRPRCDGSTEWFGIECHDAAKRFLWVNRDLLDWIDWSVVDPGQPAGRKRPQMTEAQARRVAEQTEARVMAKAAEQMKAEKARELVEARKRRIAEADAALAAEYAKRGLPPPRKGRKHPGRKPEPVKHVSLSHLHPMSVQRDPRRWLRD